MTTGPKTDWFINPATGQPVMNAPLILTPVVGDFQLVAHVRARLAAASDAVALFVHGSSTHWAKLLIERSPQGVDTIVTVVTRDLSDDANGPSVSPPGETWLRISRMQETYAFHYSRDGTFWSLARLFAIGRIATHRVGLSIQSPRGDGLTAQFDTVNIASSTLQNARDGL